MVRIIVIFTIFLIFTIKLLSQEENDFNLIEQIYEIVGDDDEQNIPIDLIEYYRKNKINLKKANINQLAILPFISNLDAYNFLYYFHKYNELSIRNICDSAGISPEAELILYQCTNDGREKYNKEFFHYRARNVNNLQEQKGFRNGNFLGDKLDIYQRLTLNYNDLSAGFTSKKNAGEQNLLDFYSGYIQYENFNTNIIIGDFLPQFGTGTLIWKSFGSRKGIDLISPTINIGNNIIPYTSTIESNYFRGIALEYEFSTFEWLSTKASLFYSNTQRSATIDDSGKVTSIFLTGYFRTENEINKKNNLNEIAIGTNFAFYINRLQFGISYLYLKYDKFINSKSYSNLYGDYGLLQSYYINYNYLNFSALGELSLDAQNNFMFKTALQQKIENLEMTLNYRYISDQFRSPYGYSFGEYSNINNEQGLYTAITYHYRRKINIGIYADIYSTLTRTYFVPAKVRGIDLFTEAIYRFNNRNSIKLRIKNENKTQYITNITPKQINDANKQTIRIESFTNINRYLQFRLRLEANNIDYQSVRENESGMMIMSEINTQFTDNLTMNFRYTTFSTDSYQTAIWQFEYLTAGYIRNALLDGMGSRFFFNLNYKIIENIKLSLAYTMLSKNHVNSLSSSYTEIEGNTQSQATLQLDISF